VAEESVWPVGHRKARGIRLCGRRVGLNVGLESGTGAAGLEGGGVWSEVGQMKYRDWCGDVGCAAEECQMWG